MHKNVIDTELSAALKARRAELGLTQKGFAGLLRISRETYQRAECDAKFSTLTRMIVRAYFDPTTTVKESHVAIR